MIKIDYIELEKYVPYYMVNLLNEQGLIVANLPIYDKTEEEILQELNDKDSEIWKELLILKEGKPVESS